MKCDLEAAVGGLLGGDEGIRRVLNGHDEVSKVQGWTWVVVLHKLLWKGKVCGVVNFVDIEA